MANTRSKVNKAATAKTETTQEKTEKVVVEKTIIPEKVITEKVQYKVKETLDPDTLVTVRNGFQGILVYKSKKTGEKFVWETFGAEQEIELKELKNAKNSSKTFFINNWFLFDDPAVIEYLGVGQYYKNALTYDSFDELFSKSPDEIISSINALSVGQKKSVAYRAKQMISEQEIDSIKVISALEKGLGIDLIDRA